MYISQTSDIRVSEIYDISCRFFCSYFECILSYISEIYDVSCRRVARIWKRGGFFKRVRKVQTTLTRIFIVLESKSHDLTTEFFGNLGNLIVFSAQKQVVSKKKKKKVFTEIESDFSAKIGNSNVFSAQEQAISKK